MRTLSEIYQANRAQSIALEQALAQAQQQAAEAQRKIVENFLARKFGSEMLTDEVVARLELLSSEQLDDLLFEAAAWNSFSQMANYFDSGSV
jgi:arginine deiminase